MRKLHTTLLIILVFVAFALQILGVFSEPVSDKKKLSIASRDGYKYGVLGFCPPASSTDGCTTQIGYTFQGDSKSSWSKSTQKTLSEIMIVHIVAAGMLLIAVIMCLGTLFKNRTYYICTETWLVLCVIASTLSFVVEIVLFGTDLLWTGWVVLGSAILMILSAALLAFMLIRVKHNNGTQGEDSSSTNTDEKSFFGNGPVVVYQVGDLSMDHDDDKLLKPLVNVSSRALPIPRQPVSKYTGTQQGYQKIPESRGPTFVPNQKTSGGFPAANGSSERVGAVLRSSPARMGVNGVDPPNAAGGTLRNAPRGDTGVLGVGRLTGNNAVGAVGDAAGALASNNRQRNNNTQPPGSNCSQNQDTWSKAAPSKVKPQQQGKHSPAPSEDSTGVARVPAGLYLVPSSNAVRVPGVYEHKSAVIDYEKSETQSRSPVANQKVMNFSRMSMQDKGTQAKQKNKPNQAMNPMLQRYVESTSTTAPTSATEVEPFYDRPNKRIPTNSPESEASHYTSVSQRNEQVAQQQQTSFPKKTGTSSNNCYQNNNGYQNNYGNQNAGYNGYQNAGYNGYQNTGYQYGYQNGYNGYQNYGYNNYRQPQHQTYGYQNYNYSDAPNFNGYQGYQQSPNQQYANPNRRRAAAPTSRSDLVLSKNPDFVIGGTVRKPRAGRNF